MRRNYFGMRNCPSGIYDQSWCKVCRFNKFHNKYQNLQWKKDRNGRMIMEPIYENIVQ